MSVQKLKHILERNQVTTRSFYYRNLSTLSQVSFPDVKHSSQTLLRVSKIILPIHPLQPL